MKKLTFIFFMSFIPCMLLLATAGGSEKPLPSKLDVSFADPSWDGVNVPKGQQCQRFGGNNPSTPKLEVKNIPDGTDAIIMEYSDRRYFPMDNGGHGKIGYIIPKASKEIIIPSVPGHSFVLPDNFFIVSPHLAPSWDKPGAYMPPCSGGMGNSYYVTVKAVSQEKVGSKKYKVLGKAVLEIGIY